MSLTSQTTPQEFTGLMRTGLAGVTPEPGPLTPPELVAKFRRTLLDFRAQGYSYAQLATCLEQPAIGVKIAPTTLERLLRATRRKRRSRRVERAAATGLVQPSSRGQTA